MGRRRVSIAIVLGLLLVAGLLVATQVPSSPLAWSCTVGVAGTNLNVSVSGWGAGSACQQLIAKTPSLTGQGTQETATGGQVNVGQGYPVTLSGTLMCTYELDSLTFTVLDSGVLNVLGTAACQYLKSQTPAAKAATAKASAAQAAAQRAAAEAATQQAAEEAAQQAAQQLSQEESAISDAASTVTSDLASLASDVKVAYAGPGSLVQDAQQAQKDLNQTQADLQKVQIVGPTNLECGSDAGTVAVDAGAVQVDLGSIQVDNGTQQGSDQSVASDIQTVDSGLSQLSQAEAALDTVPPPGVLTQSQVDAAVASAKSDVSHGDGLVASALSQVQKMVTDANTYAQQAKNICG
ncbi:MAG TPA: hypothetical protein VMV09_00340 [Candidatus Saccharimonadales bacterium]|nr:hypothetical protein [Candidatus Saccharimonadales bacterium]